MSEDKPKPPPSPWLDLARAIAADPDGAIAGRVGDFIGQSLQQRKRERLRVVWAIADALAAGEDATSFPAASEAIAAWERRSGQRLLPDEISGLYADARLELLDRRRRPPAIESIVKGWTARPDYAYEAGDLGGFQGIWHRMWALLCLEAQGASAFDGDELGSSILRHEFEARLTRPLDTQEWHALVAHARRRAAEIDGDLWGGPRTI